MHFQLIGLESILQIECIQRFYDHIQSNKLMNINPDKEIGIGQKKFTFEDHGSPYLSPLQGLSEPSEQMEDLEVPGLDIDPSSNKSAQIGLIEHDQYMQNEMLPISNQDPMGLSQNQSPSISQEVNQISNNGAAKEIKIEQQSLIPGNINSLIIFFVAHDSLHQNQLQGYCHYFTEGSEDLKTVFDILTHKFKRLRKTKEQMTKYCMRKAFRFISDYKTNLKKKNVEKTQTDITIAKINYEIPFKKNSQEKTMNAQFLKHTFSQEEFVVGYQEFLKNIHELIDKDNNIKVNAFAESIEKAIQKKQYDRIRKWNRLPWTQKILQKTKKLAYSLLQYASGNQQGEVMYNNIEGQISD